MSKRRKRGRKRRLGGWKPTPGDTKVLGTGGGRQVVVSMIPDIVAILISRGLSLERAKLVVYRVARGPVDGLAGRIDAEVATWRRMRAAMGAED